MSRHKPLYALASLILLGALPAYSKCGLGGCPSDAKITVHVEKRLREDPATAPPNLIYVQTSNHVVYLSGLVDTRSEKKEAEADARGTAGVTDVVNTIVGHTP
jgi:osmotically-inducible protein OsmY